jgi:hypothetical protein
MNEASIIQYITDTFDGVETVTSSGNTFFFFGPERKFPFVTLVTNDEYDTASNLNRPSVFRLNIGISKQTYRSLFGSQSSSVSAGNVDSSYDFTALDKLMPHPVYGMMYWVCVLSPSDTTFKEVVQPLLAEAYQLDVSKRAKRASRG